METKAGTAGQKLHKGSYVTTETMACILLSSEDDLKALLT
jgi:hypothetical protein